MFARSSTLTYKSHVILISLTVGTPRNRASADECPAVRCYQTLVKGDMTKKMFLLYANPFHFSH